LIELDAHRADPEASLASGASVKRIPATMSKVHRIWSGFIAAFGAALVASPSGVDATVSHSNGLANRKGPAIAAEDTPLLGTLVQTHTDERVPLDDRSPTGERFAALLQDRITGEAHDFDPRLIELLRALARRHPGARFELVSGYRSPKLNEMMRKKGHHVASHSQHSLGHAVDFRVVIDPESRGIDPRILEREIRDLGWTGGVGAYTAVSSDWFVHADVGPTRRWSG
jgi:uncharacterized protein YcbK (DUF882 family)